MNIFIWKLDRTLNLLITTGPCSSLLIPMSKGAELIFLSRIRSAGCAGRKRSTPGISGSTTGDQIKDGVP